MQPFFYLHKPFFKIFCCCSYLVMTKWQFLFATMHSFFTKAIYSKPVFYLFSIKVSQMIILLPSCTFLSFMWYMAVLLFFFAAHHLFLMFNFVASISCILSQEVIFIKLLVKRRSR